MDKRSPPDSQKVIESFREYNSATRTNSSVVVLNDIRNFHQKCHVTEVDAKNVSLLEFAQAGEAKANPIPGLSFDATRKWTEAVDTNHQGTLEDVYHFVCLQIAWKDCKYTVYYATWKDTYSPTTRMFYIVCDCEKANDGHCTKTDDLIKAAGNWTSQAHKEVFVFDRGSWRKEKHLWESIQTSSWENVIMDPVMKQALYEDVHNFFNSEESYAKWSITWKRGILLYGPPGNGKTVTIKALMKPLSNLPSPIPSLYVKSFEPTHGRTKQDCIHQVFSQARLFAPCVLVFEDLDTLVTEGVRSYFLNEVDGAQLNHGILIIGSANDLHKLDPAIKDRPSRFDRKYYLRLPEKKERISYAEHWRGKIRNAGVDFPEELCGVIALLTENFSFAYLQELFISTALALRDINKEEERGNESIVAADTLLEVLGRYASTMRQGMNSAMEGQDNSHQKKSSLGSTVIQAVWLLLITFWDVITLGYARFR